MSLDWHHWLLALAIAFAVIDLFVISELTLISAVLLAVLATFWPDWPFHAWPWPWYGLAAGGCFLASLGLALVA